MRPINTLVIHHSACKEGSVEQFRKEHKAKGWNDIGYHAVIGNGHGQADGLVQQGRADSVVGSGVYGANTGKLHVCLVGNFHRADPGYAGRPTRAQLDSLGGWLLNRGNKYHISSDRVVGHKEVTIKGHATACPGDQFPLPLIRTWYDLHLHNKTVVSLSKWLAYHGYFCQGVANEVAPIVLVVRGKQFTGAVKTIDGKTYVAVSDLALAMNWPQPEWNPAKREVTVLTDTK